ncbi:MAG: hypothetical protein ACP5E5_09620 [Acidobacteriaceae bacterium]
MTEAQYRERMQALVTKHPLTDDEVFEFAALTFCWEIRSSASAPNRARKRAVYRKIARMTHEERQDWVQDMYAKDMLTDEELFQFGAIMLRSGGADSARYIAVSFGVEPTTDLSAIQKISGEKAASILVAAQNISSDEAASRCYQLDHVGRKLTPEEDFEYCALMRLPTEFLIE